MNECLFVLHLRLFVRIWNFFWGKIKKKLPDQNQKSKPFTNFKSFAKSVINVNG